VHIGALLSQPDLLPRALVIVRGCLASVIACERVPVRAVVVISQYPTHQRAGTARDYAQLYEPLAHACWPRHIGLAELMDPPYTNSMRRRLG